MREQYSKSEDDIIRSMMAERYPIREIAGAIGRPESSVSTRVRQLKIKRYKTERWTPDEDAILISMWKEHYQDAKVSDALPGRSVAAIRKRAFDLGLKRDGRKTRLAARYGVAVLANESDPVLVMERIRDAENRMRELEREAHASKVNRILDEMQRGLEAGVDRSFMFTAALVAGATLQAIGDRVGLTRERVRQLVEKRKESQQS